MEVKTKPLFSGKQKRILKLAFDAVMLALLVLMYKKQVISLEFHEIGGLALIGLFVVHHLFSARWIGAVTKRFFKKNLSGLVRARYIADVLMVVAFLAVGITGVLISQVLFSFRTAGNVKTLHYFSAAFAILLTGVHFGLHADYTFGKLFKKGAKKAAKIALSITAAALIAFGTYSLFTTSFVSYLAVPPQSVRFSHGTFEPQGDLALDGFSGEHPSDLSELPELTGENSDHAQQGGSGGGFNGGRGQSSGARQTRERGSTSALMLIAQYVSIIALFAAVTYGLQKLLVRKKRPLPAADPGNASNGASAG